MTRVTLFEQSFTNSDGTSVASHCSMDADLAGGLEIHSNGVNAISTGESANRVTASSTDDDGNNPPEFADEQWAEVKVGRDIYNFSPGPMVRLQGGGTGDGYLADPFLFFGGLEILRYDGSSGTFLASGGATTPAVNDDISLEMEGSSLDAKINGTSQVTATDSSHTGGNPGVYCYDGTNTDIGLSFKCGNLYSRKEASEVARTGVRAQAAQLAALRRTHHGRFTGI